jgi:hypothetical protein
MSLYLSLMLSSMNASPNRTGADSVTGGRLAAAELANGPLQAHVGERITPPGPQGEPIKRGRTTGVAVAVE